MPMTQPGGGGALSQLSDVNVRDDAGIDQNGLIYNASTGKWIATLNLATVPNISTFSATDKSSQMTISNSNRTATINATAFYVGVRGNTARATGKYYLEFTTTTVSNADYGVGFVNAAYVLSSGNASNANYVYLDDAGTVHYNAGGGALSTTYTAGSVVGVALDFGNNAIWFRTGAGNWNNNAANNPATNTGGYAIPLLTVTSLYPVFKGSTLNDACTINTGGSAFGNPAPAGFLPWDIFAPQGNTVGASPVTFTAPTTGMYAISGGTVSAITLARGISAAVNLGATAGTFAVSQGDILTVTYTAAPTVTFIPLAD